MNRTTLRRSRRVRRCAEGWGHSTCRVIDKGELYLEHVISPDHEDIGNAGWWRTAECRDCAERYGRGHLFPLVTA